VSALLFKAGAALTGRLPARVRYGASRAVGAVGYVANPGLRRQALENYAGVLQLPVDHPQVRRVAIQAVVGYTKLMADFLLLSSLTPARIRKMVKIKGLEHVHAALEDGKGAIVVTPHFGNWDIAAAAAVVHGVPLVAVTDDFGSEAMNAAVVEARERIGMKVVPLDHGAGRAVLRALRANKVAALVCDLPKNGRNVEVLLCGQRAMLPAGPALLSLRSGAPIIPITCHRQADDTYTVHIQPRVEFAPAGADDVRSLAQAVLDRFEPILRAQPEQWYLFSPMWDQVA
jgi:KDO2-lipid IV(A) lauroyltransferase